MEVLTCSALHHDEKSCNLQEKSVMKLEHDGESNCGEHAKKLPIKDDKGVLLLPNLELSVDRMQFDAEQPDAVKLTLEGYSDRSEQFGFDVNGQEPGGLVDHQDAEDAELDEQSDCKEACLDFQNSNVVVDTNDCEPLCENKDELSVSVSKWPEHDESLALWVKWRGKWQAGIKCARADWPLATVNAKPTHDRKHYIVIFFPHTRNYSWVDTEHVCAIDEIPHPIAHRSHKVGVQLVEDLTVARRFIMKKLVIGMLNIVDQLPIQSLVETARDGVVFREFATEASRCKSYADLGRLLLKLRNMLLLKCIDANWLQHSFQPWVKKCQNALSAESIELLKEELVNSILWNEVNALRDAQGQPPEWKMWKHEAMKSFSTTQPISGGGDMEQPSLNGVEQQYIDNHLVTSLQISRKRPKLEVRRAEPHNSLAESFHNNTLVEIDSASFVADNTVVGPPEKIENMRAVLDTSIMDSVQSKDVTESLPLTVVIEGKSSASKYRNQQCIAFVEAKGRRCARWANDGEEYCCVHLTSSSHFEAIPVKVDITPPVDQPMCQGTTTVGSRCKHRSLLGSSFCKKHKPRDDGLKSSSSPHLKRKLDELLQNAENTSCKDIVVFGDAQPLLQKNPVAVIEENRVDDRNSLFCVPEGFSDSKEISCCIGLGLHEGGAHCVENPKRHSLYCDKHIPNWLKRARNGKSRIISKEVFVDLLASCASLKQKIRLHQACELFYKLLKSVLSSRSQVPKEIQFQWALSEASKDLQVADLFMKLISREKERLRRIWGFNLVKDAQSPSAPVNEQSLVPVQEEQSDYDGTFRCKICSEEFDDDQTLGAHWIDNHNKEAQWLFRGYACAICLDSFTNRKVLETHVQERHHAQFVEHCMLIQCIPCGSHFGNSEELWSHVLSLHTEGFRQSKTGNQCLLSVGSQQKPIPSNPISVENKSDNQNTVRKFICRFCGLKFDLLPDLGRHHQAAHMGPSMLSSRPQKKGLRFYAYRLKSGRLSRPRLKKGLGSASYRLRNKGIVLKKPVNPLGAGGLNVQSHVIDTPRLGRLTESQCSTIAKMLCSEAQKTRARPNNHEILAVARSACCKLSLQSSLENIYGILPERLYLKAAKLCSEHNIQVEWHQEGFICAKGCMPPEDPTLVSVLTSRSNECPKFSPPPSDHLGERLEMDECHYVIVSCQLRRKFLQATIILCDDISFGQEKVPVPCVVDKNLLNSLHYPTSSVDGQVIFMPWESFTYATKPLLNQSVEVNMQHLQLGCGCAESACVPETCDHVYLFNSDYESAKDINGDLIGGRFPYDDKSRLILEDGCLVYECNDFCKCTRNCPNRVLQNGVKVKIEVFKTDKKGWAVRSYERILRGTFVCEFVGEVVDLQEANRRRKRYGKDGCNYFYDVGAHVKLMSQLMEEKVRYVIDATKYGNVSRFINHSCSPNLVTHLVLVESMDFQLAHIGLYAKQDITAGEELTYDYRHGLQPEQGCPCLCGASNCRGRVH